MAYTTRLALVGPAGDGRRRAELHVVGMGDHAQRARPGLVHRLEFSHSVTVGLVNQGGAERHYPSSMDPRRSAFVTDRPIPCMNDPWW